MYRTDLKLLYLSVMKAAQVANVLNKPLLAFFYFSYYHSLFGNLKPPSELSVGHTYNLFKYSIEPKWEDPQNTSGGEWRLTVSVSLKSMIEDVWLLTVMNVIGEQFSQEQSEDITGIVINIKRNEIRLAIWTKTSRNRHLQEKLGQEWKQLTGIQMRIVYLFFEDVETSGRNARARYLA